MCARIAPITWRAILAQDDSDDDGADWEALRKWEPPSMHERPNVTAAAWLSAVPATVRAGPARQIERRHWRAGQHLWGHTAYFRVTARRAVATQCHATRHQLLLAERLLAKTDFDANKELVWRAALAATQMRGAGWPGATEAAVR